MEGSRAMPGWRPGSSATRRASLYGLPLLLLLFLFVTTVLYLMGLLATATTTMWTNLALLLAPAAAAAAAVDVSWHASGQTPYNNLSAVVGGQGVPKFVFEPSGDWEDGTSNWCNMPHVRRRDYVRPSGEFELKYVEVIHRHHKRTPYSSNAFPVESYRWDCDDQGLFIYGQRLSPSSSSSAQTYWQGAISPINPFTPSGWVGTCQFPQITAGGLDDSFVHGQDLYAVYHTLLGFLPSRSDEAAWRAAVRYRVTQNTITSQVAGMLIAGMWRPPGSTPVPPAIQAAGADSLEPQYPCPAAAASFSRIQNPASDATWAAHLAAAAPLFATLDEISGVPGNDAGFHKSLDHYYDNLSARQCHAKPLPCKLVPSDGGGGGGGGGGGVRNDTSRCVDQNLADKVYRFGHWEYAHVYRGSREGLAAAAASMGVWVAELAAHLREAAGCGSGGGGGGYFVRTLFSGKVLRSASPALGTMDMVQLDTLLSYFDGLVGKKASFVVDKCNGRIPL